MDGSTKASGARWARAGLAVVGLLLAARALAAGCEPAVAKLVSLQGVIELRRAQSAQWSAAPTDAVLCPGDTLRVGERSRAALRLANESVLRLDQLSTLTLAPSGQGTTFIELLRGALNVMTRTPKPFTVRTPFLNAGVEGTEFLVRVDADAAQIVVYEGRVRAANAGGAVELASSETAIAERDAAPRRGRVVRPADAVQWALHYPSILGPSASEDPALREADALARRGRTSEAFARLEAVPPPARSARHHAYRAELLLAVGRVDEARGQIARAIELDAGSSDARALQSLIAVVRNEKDEALGLARESVRSDPRSATAQLALSYAEQARFDLPAALAASERAVTLAPDNAQAWARTAELRMAGGDLDAALAAARRASALTQDLARTQTVLGFANLARLDTAAAQRAFARAIELDQADALPRLGLGLALIRDDELTAGREAIEVAAGLDPLNSLTRSYLGKAYHEEKRDPLAGRQFDLAKALDPKDPTPWLYDALRKQGVNRPVEALRDLERSIALNDNRAVYRSRLLLDEDRASRGVGVARIYRDLGFNDLAVVEASRSVAIDPANPSAHRFLSDAYAELPRHEVARASALLQSQLLQPLGLIQPQPSAPFIDVGRGAARQLLRPGFNEYSRLYEHDRSRASVALLLGNGGVRGDEITAALLRDRFALGVGQFHYQTDGFRPNSGVRHDIYNALLQWAALPSLMVQAELRSRKTRHGDITFEFDPDDFLPVSSVDISQQTARLGLTVRPSPRTRLIASFMDNRRQEHQHHDDSGIDIRLHGTAPGRQSEVQFQYMPGPVNLTMGYGSSRVEFETQSRVMDTIGAFRGACAPAAPCDSSQLSTIRQSNAYLYANVTPVPALTATLGMGHDAYTDRGLDLRLWNPKFGLRWQPVEGLGLRAAAFKTIKRALIVDQTIEPTQIAGFNQFFDDANGTQTRTYAGAVDLRFDPTLKGLLEARNRRLLLGANSVGANLSLAPFEPWQEWDVVAGLFWSVKDRTAITVQYRRESFERQPLIRSPNPVTVLTHSVPVTLRHFLPNGLSAQVGVTHVRQSVTWLPAFSKPEGSTSFALVDAALAWRLPRLNASVTLAVNNAFNRQFAYQDDNFRSVQDRLPRYLPRRNVVLSASLSF